MLSNALYMLKFCFKINHVWIIVAHFHDTFLFKPNSWLPSDFNACIGLSRFLRLDAISKVTFFKKTHKTSCYVLVSYSVCIPEFLFTNVTKARIIFRLKIILNKINVSITILDNSLDRYHIRCLNICQVSSNDLYAFYLSFKILLKESILIEITSTTEWLKNVDDNERIFDNPHLNRQKLTGGKQRYCIRKRREAKSLEYLC